MKTVPAAVILLCATLAPILARAQVFSVNRKAVPYGFVVIATAKPDSVIVSNTGAAALVISSVTSSNARFVVSPTSGTIQPGAKGTFKITFTPTVTGVQSGNIVFRHNAPTVRDTVTVSGTGTAFSINRRAVAFGNVPVGSNSRDSVVVTNAGTTTLSITNVTSSNGTFAVSPTSASIAVAGTAKFYITFTPANGTAQAGNVVFTHSASSSPDTVAVTGTGTLPGFVLNRKTVPFSIVPLGSNRLDSVTVTDTGKAALVISSVTSSNGTFTVNPVNATIQPSQAQTFYITFTPANTNAQSGNIVFLHNAPSLHDTVAVTGTGGVAAFSVTRRLVPFGTVGVGSNKLDSVIVTDTGKVALVISGVTSSNGTFTVNPTSASIPAAGSAKFYITFTPGNTSAQSGSIVFTHNAPNLHDTVAVTGTGGVAAFSVTRRLVPFGTVGVGSNNLDSVIVTDTGKVALVISGVTSSNGTFTVNPTSASIPAAGSAKFYITFTPANTSPQSGSIVFTHNAPNLHDTVVVSGTGALSGFSTTRRSVPFGIVALGSNRLDSVIVTDTGKVALVISGVTSSNGTFAVNPANATLQPAQARTFYITFTPANTSPQTGNIVFTHNAPSLHDTVTVSGTGALAAFSVTRRSVPFGIVPQGSSRLDSVTVTDSSAIALVISSVTSSNGTFTVNPVSATIQPFQSRKFYLTFTPVNAGPQAGNVVFNHNAPGLHDTVTVSGTGGPAGFSLNRKTVAFGAVIVGGSALDSVAVSDTGVAPLVISSVTSTNARFTVSPPNVTIPAGGTQTFRITFRPLNTSQQNGSIVFNHNAPSLHDTVSVSGSGLTSLAPPALLGPDSGTAGQTLPVTLSWTSVTGATGYWLQMATDPAFSTVAVSDSTLTTAGKQVNGLPLNTQYFWRVSTKNTIGFGFFSAPWTFTTASVGPVTGSVTFSGSVTSTAYRMFGLPGIGRRKAGDILSGTQKIDWRMLRDNGANTTYPAYYVDLTADSALRTGEGYWLLQRTTLNISRTDTLPPLGSDGTYSIPLHSGWNIIANPFNVTLLRSAIFAANGLPGSTVLWEHNGDTTTSSGTTFDPFKGYYFDNNSVNFPSLKIPYPFSGVTKIAGLAKAAGVDWRAELVFTGDINTDRDNYIGIAPAVAPGRNVLDQHEAPLAFDQGFLYFVRPEWDTAQSRFATDFRPSLGTGQTWDFEVWNPRKGAGKISLLGLEGIPSQYQVVLINTVNTSPADMRRSNVYTYQTTSAAMQFKLIVGTPDYVEGETSKLIPGAYALEQNYPNPFNPSTTISYMLPAGANVRLEILSVLGQRVRILDEGFRPAATYSVIWDGKDDNRQSVSSGVYFCRLIAGGNAIRTRKLVLLK